jgi:hypothetical protein
MTQRRRVLLDDGSTVQIVRLETSFPSRQTMALVWQPGLKGPGIIKVDARRIVGPVDEEHAA